jgi:hypothetical protein
MMDSAAIDTGIGQLPLPDLHHQRIDGMQQE